MGSKELKVCQRDLMPLERYARTLGITLDKGQLDQFELYTTELLEWNRRINLTGLKTKEEVVVHHHMDSITPGRYLLETKRLMDFGTGAGFPGIPLKIAMPDIELYLVEARRKKLSFLRNVVLSLSLDNVHLCHGRVEDKMFCEEHRESMDTVITRAALKVRQVLDAGHVIVREGGRIVIMKGAMRPQEVREIESFMSEHGTKGIETLPYTLPGMERERYLIVVTR